MLGRAPRTKETLPNFFFSVKIWIPINGTQQLVSGHPKSIGIPRVDGFSMGPWIWGVIAWYQSLS